MKKQRFLTYVNSFRPGSEITVRKWWDWAEEMSGYDKNTTTPGDRYHTAEEYLDEIYEILEEIRQKYSDDIAAQIITLADIHACPYMWEIKDAADYLASGGTIYDIIEMESEGALDDLEYYFKIQERVRAEGYVNKYEV